MAKKETLVKKAKRSRRGKPAPREGYLAGQLLIAMPGMRDPRFARSVIYLCAHSEDGAMGIIINQRADDISFPELLMQAHVVAEGREGEVPSEVRSMPVHIGGPVESSRGFVLHSPEYTTDDSTMAIDDDVSLTTTVDILRAIAVGEGPDKTLFALGYAGWEAGQLEREIQANGWLHCESDREIIFQTALDRKYERALSKLGVHPTHLVNDAGHA